MNNSTPYWLAAAFILFAAIYSHNANALSLHTGGYSYHVDTGHKYDYTDWHRLAAVEYGSVMAGYFRNSYNRDSFVVGYGWSKQWGHWRGAVHVGAVYGYRSCYGDDGRSGRICPVAFPSLYWTRYRVQPGVILFGEALALTVRIEL
jgi:hypothetical protein